MRDAPASWFRCMAPSSMLDSAATCRQTNVARMALLMSRALQHLSDARVTRIRSPASHLQHAAVRRFTCSDSAGGVLAAHWLLLSRSSACAPRNAAAVWVEPDVHSLAEVCQSWSQASPCTWLLSRRSACPFISCKEASQAHLCQRLAAAPRRLHSDTVGCLLAKLTC